MLHTTRQLKKSENDVAFRITLQILKLQNRINKFENDDLTSRNRISKKIKKDEFRTTMKSTVCIQCDSLQAFNHLDIYWRNKQYQQKSNKQKVNQMKSKWTLRKHLLLKQREDQLQVSCEFTYDQCIRFSFYVEIQRA